MGTQSMSMAGNVQSGTSLKDFLINRYTDYYRARNICTAFLLCNKSHIKCYNVNYTNKNTHNDRNKGPGPPTQVFSFVLSNHASSQELVGVYRLSLTNSSRTLLLVVLHLSGWEKLHLYRSDGPVSLRTFHRCK